MDSALIPSLKLIAHYIGLFSPYEALCDDALSDAYCPLYRAVFTWAGGNRSGDSWLDFLIAHYIGLFSPSEEPSEEPTVEPSEAYCPLYRAVFTGDAENILNEVESYCPLYRAVFTFYHVVKPAN